jgi:hypothetical protein
MAKETYGQTITFSTEVDPDNPLANYANFVWFRVTRSQRTIKSIAAHHGHLELARAIGDLNGIRDLRKKLRIGERIRLPGNLAAPLLLEAYPQDMRRPILKDGYAMFDQVARYGEKSITHFQGYNALQMDVYVLFEGWGIDGAGLVIENRIKALERMAGRGPGFVGAASGPPAIVRVSVTATTDSHNVIVVPLIPYSYQWNASSTGRGLVWRINGIDWDDGALSTDAGNRVRATATVHLVEHTPVHLVTTVASRSKGQR